MFAPTAYNLRACAHASHRFWSGSSCDALAISSSRWRQNSYLDQTFWRTTRSVAAVAAAAAMASAVPPPSKRIRRTDEPCIVAMQRMLRGKEGVISLAQGIVHWAPPSQVAEAVSKVASLPEANAYCADDGLPELKSALKEKLKNENNLDNVEVMVTSGANQAYANLVCALLDAEDSAVLFKPYYFNHRMALQMTGGGHSIILGETTEEFLPDASWLEKRFEAQNSSSSSGRIRMVTVVNPGNPTGTIMPKELLDRLSAACAKHDAWLVVDNTYEHFTYEQDGFPSHVCASGDHVVNVFSFSKAFGMMGWRIGYLAYPPRLLPELMKVQDTIAICPAVASQKAALAALSVGREWVKDHVRGLSANRQRIVSAVEGALGPGSVKGGTGAIYLMAQLPENCADDVKVVEWLCAKHRICVIPGSACGSPGTVRLCYANLAPERFTEAVNRLQAGLTELVKDGSSILKS
eukprot:TRINITY_DN19671_c0_g1_i1.p1 TRINITY_DN19671_c0_g1~~TRINITY_DN19671_c0_g1_i1.p1  ORF type:complete len:465 (-),score=65.34 TRINITY_DN19671_c0_g1_i1:108-1502(-)